jgi:hypothetical protein
MFLIIKNKVHYPLLSLIFLMGQERFGDAIVTLSILHDWLFRKGIKSDIGGDVLQLGY